MQKHLLSAFGGLVCASLLALTAAHAEESQATPQAGGAHKEWTLTDARKHAHEYAEKLDKMTEAEWAERQKKRAAWKEKYSKMTPEEKAAWKKKRADYRAQHQQDAAKAAAPATPTAPQ